MNRDLGEGGSRTPRQERPLGERGRARIRASGNHVKGAYDRSERQHASNDARFQDTEQCEESDARYLLSLTFAETISSVILMT